VGDITRIFSCESPGASRWQFLTYERFTREAAVEADKAAAGDAFDFRAIERLLWLVGHPDDVPPPYARDAAGRLKAIHGQLEDDGRVREDLLDRMEDAIRRLEARMGEKWKPSPPDDRGKHGKPVQDWGPKPGAVVFLRR
jgi:hypothetical protein